MTIDTQISHVTKSGANLLRELGFTPDEAEAAQRLRLPIPALGLAVSVLAAWGCWSARPFAKRKRTA